MKPTLQEIIKASAMRFGVATHEIVGRNARRPYARPRQVAMFLARELTSYSTPQIGRALARDHTTVLYSCKVIPQLVAGDPDLADHVTSAREMACLLAKMRGKRIGEALERPLVEVRAA